MSPLVPILVLATAVYGTRLAGLAMPESVLPPAIRRGLTFAPVAVLSALTVSNLSVQTSGADARVLAAVVGGLVAYRTGRLWACILSGIAVYWLLGIAGLAT